MSRNSATEKVAREWQGESERNARAFAKNDVRFWKKRIFKPLDGRTGSESPHYSVRIAHGGVRRSVSLETGNAEAAATRARDFFQDVMRIGLAAAAEKIRPTSSAPDRIATIGEWIVAAQGVSDASTTTVGQYAGALRLIAGQILSVKKSKKRFAPGKKGGAAEFRKMIDAASLEIFTPQAVQQWRLGYVKRAQNPAEERSRMTSSNSLIKQARSLFGEKIVRFVPNLKLPEPKPFAGCEFYPRQSSRYFSRIDPKALLQAAHAELSEQVPPVFLAMLLALSAGLRKGEIDSLAWHQVDFDQALIRVENTAAASLKTVDSRDEVPIDPGLISILRGFRAKATGEFVIESPNEDSGPKAWGRMYRSERVFEKLYAWLRKNGVTARKPLHELRKELGALITTEFGIYAASRILRHSDVATTARHYSDVKTRAVISMGDWLAPGNVIRMKPKTPGKALKGKTKVRRPRRVKEAA
ncbi:MAG: tyrosine-type recombinase/integrase [Verrucomicrobia bacterium]|nr:tyrosine-type recombinase/integrase [Verrucomicrobiota bacterium]